MSDSGQPQDGMDTTDDSSPELVSLLRRRPALDTNDAQETSNNEIDDSDDENIEYPPRRPSFGERLFGWIRTIILLAIPAVLLMKAEYRTPLIQTATVVWKSVSPDISPRDMFNSGDLLSTDPFWAHSTPAMAASKPPINTAFTDVEVIAEANVEPPVSVLPDPPVAPQHGYNRKPTKSLHIDLARYDAGPVRPESCTAYLLARVNRLEPFVQSMHDLASSYDEMRTDRLRAPEPFDLFGWNLLAATRASPAADTECRWNFATEQCEPECDCSWQYAEGDYWPSRVCHTRTTGQQCDGVPQVGPIRRIVALVGKEATNDFGTV